MPDFDSRMVALGGRAHGKTANFGVSMALAMVPASAAMQNLGESLSQVTEATRGFGEALDRLKRVEALQGYRTIWDHILEEEW
jgi:hypothetical protein